MADKPYDFDNDDVPPTRAHEITAEPGDDVFRERLAAFSRQLEQKSEQWRREPPRAVASRRVYTVDRSFASQILIAVAVVGVVAAAGAGSYLTLVRAVDGMVPGSPAAIVAKATAAPTAPRSETVSAGLANPGELRPFPPGPTPAVSVPEPAPAAAPLTAFVPEMTATLPPSPQVVAATALAIPPQPLEREEIAEMQRRLNALGLEAGPIDSVAGPLTLAAVRRYQERAGIDTFGVVDRDLLERLRQDAPNISP